MQNRSFTCGDTAGPLGECSDDDQVSVEAAGIASVAPERSFKSDLETVMESRMIAAHNIEPACLDSVEGNCREVTAWQQVGASSEQQMLQAENERATVLSVPQANENEMGTGAGLQDAPPRAETMCPGECIEDVRSNDDGVDGQDKDVEDKLPLVLVARGE